MSDRIIDKKFIEILADVTPENVESTEFQIDKIHKDLCESIRKQASYDQLRIGRQACFAHFLHEGLLSGENTEIHKVCRQIMCAYCSDYGISYYSGLGEL